VTARAKPARSTTARPPITNVLVIACALLLVLSVPAHAGDKEKSQGRLLFGKSDTKSVSQFDDRSQVYIDLKITQ